jgi:hypothetical protein
MKMLNFFIEFAVCFDAIALGYGGTRNPPYNRKGA